MNASLKAKIALARESGFRGQFLARLARFGIPLPVCEYKFAAPDRKWSVDFGWQKYGIALECEGAVWTQGRHTRGSGFMKDMEKYNALASRGYRLFRVTPDQLIEYGTLRMIGAALDIHLGPLGTL